jgi:hypothetical protein
MVQVSVFQDLCSKRPGRWAAEPMTDDQPNEALRSARKLRNKEIRNKCHEQPMRGSLALARHTARLCTEYPTLPSSLA